MGRKLSYHILCLLLLGLSAAGGARAATQQDAAQPMTEQQVAGQQVAGQETMSGTAAAESAIIHRAIPNAPVAPFGDTLFIVYGNLGVLKVDSRAALISEQIKTLERDAFFDADSLVIVEEDQILNLSYYDKVIMGVTDQQARLAGETKAELAAAYRAIIISAIEKEHAQNLWIVIVKQIGLSILLLAATFFCLRYLNVLYRKLRIIIKRRGVPGKIKIKGLNYFLDKEKQSYLLIFVLRIVKWILIVFILYFCLLMLFRLFPETRWLSDTLISYVVKPLKGAGKAIKSFIPNLFSIIVIIFLFRLLIKSLHLLAEKVKRGTITFKGFHRDWGMPTYSIVRLILYAFMFILIFPLLPYSNSDVFKGVSVFIGVLLSLGSTSVISNMVSGLVITYMRPFQVGDFIKMGEFQGNVTEKSSLVTRIRTPKNEVITIPNANVMTAQTINYTQSAVEYGLILYSSVTMGYGTEWRKVHELLISAALATPYVLPAPKPFVLQIALDDFYVEYQINVYTREADRMARIYSDLNTNIQDTFNKAGLELLSPHYQANRDGSAIDIPKEYIKEAPLRVAPPVVDTPKEPIDAPKEPGVDTPQQPDDTPKGPGVDTPEKQNP